MSPFSVYKASVSNSVAYAAKQNVDLTYSFSNRRYYVSFDLTGSGLALEDIASVALVLVVTAVLGGGDNFRLYTGSALDNWGDTLTADATDFHSTHAVVEETKAVNSTGVKTWSINKASLDLNGVTWFRLDNNSEGAGAPYSNRGITFNSADASSDQPVLRIVLVSGEVVVHKMHSGIGFGPGFRH